MATCDTSPLISYDDALAQLIANLDTRVDIVERPLLEAGGMILAETIESAIDVPGCAMSSMDGYAINTADLGDGETSLPVSLRIPAGEGVFDLERGSAARIFTGAPIPNGADAVIMQEQVEAVGDSIRFGQRPASGSNIRPAGNDIQRGTVILERGCRLRAQDIGLAASIGKQTLPVYAPLRVGIFFTGDELVEPGDELAAGKIYDSNRYTLNGLLNTLNCEIIDLGIVGDTLEQTRQAIVTAARQVDLVITSGGVSVGEEDHVRIALEQLGELTLWRLKIKPGKPLAFGNVDGTAFIGLPGNPVSVFATFCLFVSPFIKKLQGRARVLNEAVSVTCDFDWPHPDSRREFCRARVTRDASNKLIAELYPNQGSGVLMSTSWAAGLIDIPEGTVVRRGDVLNYLSFSEILE